MKKYLIKVAGYQYTGLFTDSWAATMDAMDRFPGAAVSAKVAP